MAERGAHLTQTVTAKPSIFDFVAHETLNDLLYPSAKKIVDVLALRNQTFIGISKWFDEYFLISHFFLQFYYLKKYSATFSEKFYGLQRVPIKSKGKTLGHTELYLSLFAVSVFPYLINKINALADKILFDSLPRTTQKKKIILMKSIIYSNSGINISYQLLKFIQHLSYLSGKTDINSPLLRLAGVKLIYAEEQDTENWTIRNLIPQLLQRSLEISAFFIQFMQWWQHDKRSDLGVLPVPPPPKKREDGENSYGNKCPICLQKRKVDTALSTSGFVFCFSCITSYLAKHNQCPITKLPATVNNLIRVYPPS